MTVGALRRVDGTPQSSGRSYRLPLPLSRCRARDASGGAPRVRRMTLAVADRGSPSFLRATRIGRCRWRTRSLGWEPGARSGCPELRRQGATCREIVRRLRRNVSHAHRVGCRVSVGGRCPLRPGRGLCSCPFSGVSAATGTVRACRPVTDDTNTRYETYEVKYDVYR
jgi:hypothetical protein